MSALLRLSRSAESRARHLRELLGDRDESLAELRCAVEDELVRGSLALASLGEADAKAELALRQALRVVPSDAPLSLEALASWHVQLVPSGGRWREVERTRPDAPPAAPPAFVVSRLQSLLDWLSAPSTRELGPAQQGTLALARIVEIAPFDEANGRLSRLAATHLMVRAGARPPLLGAADAERLRACVSAAFRLETAPLAELLEEAAERCLDVMIRRLSP